MDSKTVFELRKEAQNLSGIEKLNKLNDALKIHENYTQKIIQMNGFKKHLLGF